ncbi:uncharacterized protein C2orf81 homolog [Rhinatrema bivittatum]|uniref:uncharacterized protein C2orf81 homolog n=1 Tax=Rhinatrema bivittatum TaxID=194408 RepID=UPI0011262A75|nr:uncharacterized protein C2orf81 homolog [Rhinatrema bivittatum]
MSRPAQMKSRAEKGRITVPTPVPIISQVEIIPGRFTEADWISMVALEEGEETVGDFMDELLSRTMKDCFQVYLLRQRIPYTISQAKDATIQIIEWRFLIRDTGEACVAKDTTWQEEKEPVSGIIDSWAQGTVPVIHTGFTPRAEDEQQVTLDEPSWMSIALIPVIPTDESKLDELSIPRPASPSSAPQLEESLLEEVRVMVKSEEFSSLSKTQELVYQPSPPPKEHKPKQEYKPHRGSLQSPSLKNLTKSLETSEKELLIQELSKTLLQEETQEDLSNFKLLPISLQNILKMQLKRPKKKDVLYDEFGNIIAVPKLDLSSLPVPWIQPQAEVLGSNVEIEQQQIDVPGTSRLKGKKFASKTTEQKETKTSPDVLSRQVVKGKGSTPLSLKSGIILESMQLAPGVVARDKSTPARSVFKGPKQEEFVKKEEASDLKPIQTTIPYPSITVDQLIKDRIPRVQPITRFQTYPSPENPQKN